MSHVTFSKALTKLSEDSSWQILHATHERVRVRVPQLAKSKDSATKLVRSIKTLNGVTQVSVNDKASSIAIHYHPQIISLKQILDHLDHALQSIQKPALAPHTSRVLSERLGVTSQALTWRRSQPDFAEWSRLRDPEGIAWSYNATAKPFIPLISLEELEEQQPSPGKRVLVTLGETTSGKMGGILGKVTGEVIGLVLLGSVGMVMGAEVGAYVSEVVRCRSGQDCSDILMGQLREHWRNWLKPNERIAWWIQVSYAERLS